MYIYIIIFFFVLSTSPILTGNMTVKNQIHSFKNFHHAALHRAICTRRCQRTQSLQCCTLGHSYRLLHQSMEEKKETKMDISSILSTLGIADDDADDITRNSDEYQAYLDSPLSVDVVYPIVDSIILLDTLSHILEATPQSLSSLNIKKIAVCALSTAINSNDSNGKF